MEDNSKRLFGLALSALYEERRKIDEEIVTIQKKLGKRFADPGGTDRRASMAAARVISPEGRKAISIAAKKRWVEFRASKRKTARKR